MNLEVWGSSLGVINVFEAYTRLVTILTIPIHIHYFTRGDPIFIMN